MWHPVFNGVVLATWVWIHYVIYYGFLGSAATLIVWGCRAYWHFGSVRRRMRRLFGAGYRGYPVVSRPISVIDLPNIRRAVDAFASRHTATLEVLYADNAPLQCDWLGVASPQFQQLDIDVDERVDCATNSLFLVDSNGPRCAIRITGMDYKHVPILEVMAADRDVASNALRDIRRLMAEHSVYRGKVISLARPEEATNGSVGIKFHELPSVEGDAIILPAETMARIRRNTVTFFDNAQRLKRQGFSTKRGLLFHGPPGTGKTRTACWLTHSLPGVTVFLVTGEQLWNIKESFNLARNLTPSILVLEDVDLIATRRDQSHQTTALHELLNEMDGLDSDTDILFLLTTNQPECIEPALANRPGRIDQAIHFPLPDEGCRRRLIELYRGGATLAIDDWSDVLDRTAGASPAFIRELVRKAALFAVEESTSEAITITDRHFDQALSEMNGDHRELTRRITGFNHLNGDSA